MTAQVPWLSSSVRWPGVETAKLREVRAAFRTHLSRFIESEGIIYDSITNPALVKWLQGLDCDTLSHHLEEFPLTRLSIDSVETHHFDQIGLLLDVPLTECSSAARVLKETDDIQWPQLLSVQVYVEDVLFEDIDFADSWFDESFPSLATNWDLLADSSFDGARTFIESAIWRTSEKEVLTLNLLGTRISGRLIGYAGPVTLGSILWYLLVYLRGLVRVTHQTPESTREMHRIGSDVRKGQMTSPLPISPWMGAMGGVLAVATSLITLAALPAVAIWLLTSKMMFLGNWSLLLGILFALPGLYSAYLGVAISRKLRIDAGCA